MDSRNINFLHFDAVQREEHIDSLGTGMSMVTSYITGLKYNHGTLFHTTSKGMLEEIGQMITFMIKHFLHDNNPHVCSIFMHSSLSNTYFIERRY